MEGASEALVLNKHDHPRSRVRRVVKGRLYSRRYIRQLRTIPHPRSAVPGPLCTKEPRMCESPIFGQVRSNTGPFASYQKLSAFYNDRLRRALESQVAVYRRTWAILMTRCLWSSPIRT